MMSSRRLGDTRQRHAAPPRRSAGRPGWLIGGAGALTFVGVLLALMVPALGLRAQDCAVADCGAVQAFGKVATSVGVAVLTGALTIGALRARRFEAAGLAALVFVPVAVWSVLNVQVWLDTRTGSGQVAEMVFAARQFAAAEQAVPADSLQALLTNGRGDWAVVRIVAPDGARSYVLLQRSDAGWQPRVLGQTFSREQLAALGAPTNLMTDAE